MAEKFLPTKINTSKLTALEVSSSVNNIARQTTREIEENIRRENQGLPTEYVESTPAGLTPEKMEDGLQKMKQEGALKYREQLMQIERSESISGIKRALDRILEYPKNPDIRSSFAIMSSSHNIENRHIFITDVEDEGCIDIDFYLTPTHFNEVVNVLSSNYEKSCIDFHSKSKTGEDKYMRAADSFRFQEKGCFIDISRESLEDHEHYRRKAMERAVRIRIPKDKIISAFIDKTAREIQNIFAKYFQIHNAFCELSGDSLERYMVQCYTSHHKIKKVDPKAKLSLEEWTPGTFTIVDKGKHEEYIRKYGNYAVFFKLRYKIGDKEIPALLKIIRAGGLLSGIERNRRGLMVNQASIGEDIKSGGAKTFFTRTACEHGLNEMEQKQKMGLSIIFDPSIFDSTNWYSSAYDTWGKTDHSAQTSPDELLEILSQEYKPANEQMFQYGIPLSKIKAISFPLEELRQANILYLRKNGITEVAGKTLEDFLIVCPTLGSVIEFSK